MPECYGNSFASNTPAICIWNSIKSFLPFSTFLKPCAPYLALAGDIGHPTQLKALFEWAAPQWKHIFYIPGNHEYYGADFEERQKELSAFAYPNIHFLQSGSFYCEEENVAVIGATLWTHASEEGGWRSVSDYRHIRCKGSTFTKLKSPT